MRCRAELKRVQWEASRHPSASSRLLIAVNAPNQSSDDVRVLEFTEKESAWSIRNTIRDSHAPVLLLVHPELVREGCRLLRDKDDLCLADTPWDLIEFRLCRLKANANKGLDGLTALRSRKELIRYLDDCCTEAAADRPVSVVLLDLDQFKAFNDHHGHAAGDALLVECAQLLNEYSSREFFVARFGGEEFVLVSRLDEQATRRTAESIRLSVSSREFAGNLRVTTSIGISTTTVPLEVSDLLSYADEALYAAKAGGRNQVYTWNQLKKESSDAGEDVDVAGLENRARVFSERVTSLITRRSRRLIADLKLDATTDPLTQLYNRRYLDSQLIEELNRAHAEDYPLTIALIDVDHFGEVNKQYGWPTGDTVLRQVSCLVRSNIRATDWAGRYGGEEFCLVLVNTTLSQSRVVLERLRSAVEDTRFLSTAGQPLALTISVGAAELGASIESPLQLVELASTQTLAAKNAGRNRVYPLLLPTPHEALHVM